ncbi:hypothetical protein C5C56_11720 [Rathayibacter sp. AY1D1]|jgi:hypothetical protein|uniref:hypothetical protein n=1 Tax=Rathayibacter sp. AY1D1 TaxID=2080542 RepID=UPI000CE8B287|nr:hypothetical protein [Rathayibacter sp. AY1D1]PPH97815.1 hypothetical protein C5C56_11720 [Rathayibacter sp. AY1D1]
MDIGVWLNFLAQSTALLIGCYVIVAVVTGLALAFPAGVPRWAAVTISVLVPLVGPLVLMVVVAVRRTRRPLRTGTQATPPAPVTAEPAISAPFGMNDTFDPFGASGPDVSGVAATGRGASPFGTAPPPSTPSPWTGASGASASPFGVPSHDAVAGAAPAQTASASIATARARLASRTAAVRATHRPLTVLRLVLLAVLVLAVSGTGSLLLVGWFTFDSRIVPPLSVSAWGTGLDVAVIATAAVLVVVLVRAWWRPSRAAAVAAALVGGCWTFASGSVLALAAPVTELLGDIGAISYDLGDLLGSFGLTGSAGVVELPEGIDLSAVGIVGRTVDLRAVDLAAPIPAATLELGPGWFIALAVGLVVMLWSIVEVVVADRGVRNA